MGWMKDKTDEADKIYRAIVTPYVAPGEELLGVFMATQVKTFGGKMLIIGVMPTRFVMVPINRKMEVVEAPISVTAPDILKSSVDGFGGGLSHFLTSDLGDIRFTTAQGSYKLMALGGGMDQLITGDGQLQGKTAFLQFLAAARGVR